MKIPGAQQIKDIFVSSGAANYSAVASGVAMATSAIDGSLNYLHDANRLDPNTFQNAGYAGGGLLGAGADFAINGIGSLAYFGLRHNGAEAIAHKGTAYTHDMLSGMTEARRATIMAEGVEGVFQKNMNPLSRFISKRPFMGGSGAPKGFMRNMGMMKGIGIMTLPLMASMAASSAMGFAGHIMDQAWESKRMMRQIHYDNRFFDTGKYDQSTYQQVGSAMNNYESKLVSLSRVYHSR
jgi:hypothetical protein